MAEHRYVNPRWAQTLKEAHVLEFRRASTIVGGEVRERHDGVERRLLTLGEALLGASTNAPRDASFPIELIIERYGLLGGAGVGGRIFRAIPWLDEAGIGTFEPIALLEMRRFGRVARSAAMVAWPVGRDLCETLATYGRVGARRGSSAERSALLAAVGELLAKLHTAKIRWSACVAKNVIVTPVEGPKMWRLSVVGVDAMDRKFGRGERVRSVETLLDSLRGFLSASDVLRMLVGYVGLVRVRSGRVRMRTVRRFFGHVVHWVDKQRRERRDQATYPIDRPLAEEENFRQIDDERVNVSFSELLAQNALAGDGAMMRFAGGSELYKPGMGGRFRYRVEVRDPSGSPMWMYLKRTCRPKFSEQVSRFFSGTLFHSSAYHERAMIQSLSAARIGVPQVVGWSERMAGPYERRSALVTLGIVGQTLEKFVPKHFSRSARDGELAERRSWIRDLGEVIGRFHREGFCHRDLYLCHIFIGIQSGRRPVFTLIDLARCFRVGWFRRRWIVKDLASLNYSAGSEVSRSDRMRFLMRYLSTNQLDAGQKKLVRQVLAKTQRIARHDRRHRRVTVERKAGA